MTGYAKGLKQKLKYTLERLEVRLDIRYRALYGPRSAGAGPGLKI